MDSLELVKFANLHKEMKDPDTAHLVIGLNEVISSNLVDGIAVTTEELPDGVRIKITVAENTVIKKPVHMCFGLLQEQGVQKIDMDLEVRKGAKIDVVAHCIFPNAADVKHLMDANIRIDEDAHYTYFERHIHSAEGGITVVPKAKIMLGKNSRFKTDFELLEGRVGLIDIDYDTTCEAHSVMEMTAKISGKGDDVIKIRETGHLLGEHSTGVLTSRVAVTGNAKAEVYNKLTASAAYARGHVDCKEILKDNGTASAIPIVEVNHPKAHVTHEAALGSVDTKQLETLMARGLDEDQASDLIIEGLLS